MTTFVEAPYSLPEKKKTDKCLICLRVILEATCEAAAWDPHIPIHFTIILNLHAGLGVLSVMFLWFPRSSYSY